MRKYKILISCLILGFTLEANSPKGKGAEIYLNAYMEVVEGKQNATYYCQLVKEDDRGYFFQVFYLSGELKMDGWFADSGMKVEHGSFKYYYRSGQVESMGEYTEGMKTGVWQRYSEDGTPKPEKVYASHQIMKAIEAAKVKSDKEMD